MIIRVLPVDFEHDLAADPAVHVVTFAEPGFSMLDQYMRSAGLSVDDVQRFGDAVNRADDPGSLVPRLNLSAIPRRCIRAPDSIPMVDREQLVAEHVGRVLLANRESPQLRSRRMLFDFRKPGVDAWALHGVFRALLHHNAGFLEEVGLISPPRRVPSAGGITSFEM